jgi:hypothetical protein
MTTALTLRNLPKDQKTGLTLPLSKSLGSQDLAQHRAMVGVELEVLAKKFDRFGWERDRGSMAHDRTLSDWMDALQDYPLDEVKAACRTAVLSNPNKMPNEGHVAAEIIKARKVKAAQAATSEPVEPEPAEPRVTKEQAAKILEEAGFKPRKFGGAS